MTNTTAEIKSGLTEGQAVVTGVNTPQTGTATTTTAASAARSGGGGFPVGGGGGTAARRPGTEPMSDAIISLDHVSRIYDMGHVAGARAGRRQPRGPARRVRRDRRAVRVRQDAR